MENHRKELPPWIGEIKIRGCNVKRKKYPIRVKRGDSINILNCSLFAPSGKSSITIRYVGAATILYNKVFVHNSVWDGFKNNMKDIVG